MATFELEWGSDRSYVLLNPRLDGQLRHFLETEIAKIKELHGHCWFATSGSTGDSHTEIKLAALSKEALLTSAKAVNQHLQTTHEDSWLLVLPRFHVGGVGILARAFLSNSKVIDLSDVKWSVDNFNYQTLENGVTLTALVPTHLYDIVSRGFKAPESLRAVIIGGGQLNPQLYFQARALGWPVLPSYGLTECCSQVATARLESLGFGDYPLLYPLSHVRVSSGDAGNAILASQSLLSAFGILLKEGEFKVYDPKIGGEFITEDVLTWRTGGIASVERVGDFVKIGGESVNLKRLELIWGQSVQKAGWKGDSALLDVVDERLGKIIALAVSEAESEAVGLAIEAYQEAVLPFERIRKVYYEMTIPRSPLLKLLKQQLLNSLIK